MTAVVNAVLLAGGTLEESLRPVVSPVVHKAWIPLGDRLLIERVLDAIEGCKGRVEQRVLVARREEVPASVLARFDAIAAPGDSPLQSWENGVKMLKRRDLPVLGIPCDLCFLQPESIIDFLDRCGRQKAEVYYAYVRRETSEARYPGLRHTWLRLREGVFCGGGLGLMTPEAVSRARAFIEEITRQRKSIIKMAATLGPKIIFKFLLRTLSVADLEERFSLLMKAHVVGIESPCADVGFNVDAPDELTMARRLVAEGDRTPNPLPLGGEGANI